MHLFFATCRIPDIMAYKASEIAVYTNFLARAPVIKLIQKCLPTRHMKQMKHLRTDFSSELNQTNPIFQKAGEIQLQTFQNGSLSQGRRRIFATITPKRAAAPSRRALARR
jgi:hypothetical protein